MQTPAPSRTMVSGEVPSMKNIAVRIGKQLTVRTGWLIFLLAAALTMAGASKSSNSITVKKAGARPDITDPIISFPGASGLVITANSASIGPDGTITATYTLTDS